MKLLRFVIGCALVGALGYGAVSVPLGERTLWEHVRAIAGTDESRRLVEDVRHTADQVKRRALGGRTAHEPPPAAPADQLTDDERALLRRLIKEKLASGPARGSSAPSAQSGPPAAE